MCPRVSEYVSLELDGELSLLERAILRRHLQRCAHCAEVARQMRHATELLRTTPLELPSRPIVVRRARRPLPRVAPLAAALAAVVAAAIWLGLPSSGGPRQQQLNLHSPRGAILGADGRYDWPAGVPRTVEVVQLFPGGLYNTNADT